MRVAAISCVLLLGCGVTDGNESRTFRDDPMAILASKADFVPERMTGYWHEVARFPDGLCGGGLVRFGMDETGRLLIEETCGGARQTARAEQVGPGRLRMTQGDLARDLWVLWTDTNYRTAILVAPDGSGGRVLNRDPVLPGDRREAVLEILDFNGFNTSLLTFSPAG